MVEQLVRQSQAFEKVWGERFGVNIVFRVPAYVGLRCVITRFFVHGYSGQLKSWAGGNELKVNFPNNMLTVKTDDPGHAANLIEAAVELVEEHERQKGGA